MGKWLPNTTQKLTFNQLLDSHLLNRKSMKQVTSLSSFVSIKFYCYLPVNNINDCIKTANM